MWELGQLVAARDADGVLWWVVEGAAARWFGPFASDAIGPFRVGEWSWSPWARDQLGTEAP